MEVLLRKALLQTTMVMRVALNIQIHKSLMPYKLFASVLSSVLFIMLSPPPPPLFSVLTGLALPNTRRENKIRGCIIDNGITNWNAHHGFLRLLIMIHGCWINQWFWSIQHICPTSFDIYACLCWTIRLWRCIITIPKLEAFQ